MPDVNHLDLVRRLHAEQPPAHTLEGALDFLVRVLRALPRDERGGMVRSKPGNEGTLPFQGVFVRVGRVCYPDGQRFKILTGIPTKHDPVWNDEGVGDPAEYFDVQPFLPGPAPTPLPEPTPGPSPAPVPEPLPGPDELDALLRAADDILKGMVDVRDAIVAQTAAIAELRDKGIPLKFTFR